MKRQETDLLLFISSIFKPKNGQLLGGKLHFDHLKSYFITATVPNQKLKANTTVGSCQENVLTLEAKNKTQKNPKVNVNECISLETVSNQSKIICFSYDNELFNQSEKVSSVHNEFKGDCFQLLHANIKSQQKCTKPKEKVNKSKKDKKQKSYIVFLEFLFYYVHELLQKSHWFTHIENNYKQFKNSTNNKSIVQRNFYSAKIFDFLLGLITIYFLIQHKSNILDSVLHTTKFFIDGLKQVLNILMDSPAGLKLNYALNQSLAIFFFYHISLWRAFIQSILTVSPNIVYVFAVLGSFGFSYQIALCADLIMFLTFHVYCIYVYAARLYRVKIYTLTSLWRLFIGRKYNPLKHRVDSFQYSHNQLFVGTLCFTILLFLLPTTFLYYIVFTMFRVCVLAVCKFMHSVATFLSSIPFYMIFLRLVDSATIKGSIRVYTTKNIENSTLKLHCTLDLLNGWFCNNTDNLNKTASNNDRSINEYINNIFFVFLFPLNPQQKPTRTFSIAISNIFKIICLSDQENESNVDPLLVTTSAGKLRGKQLTDKNNGIYYAFQKIPYAKKPLGNLRFKAPQKAEKWNGILNATKIAPNCLQDGKDFSTEDCLYLNVFSHRNKELQPVMVYIYGGGLTSGSSNPDRVMGAQFLLTKNIVLVTLNYRLGLLGFLSFEDGGDAIREEISANNGFKDQILALEWVQDNIKQFGGDPNSVTLFGNSAGGVSSHLLLLSPLSENLFHRVIIQSGTAITRGLAMNNSAVHVARFLNIDTRNATKIVQTLKNLTEDEIFKLQADVDVYKLTIDTVALAGVTIEKPGPKSFMVENPWKIMQEGTYHRRPIMTGILDAEGLIFFVYKHIKNTTRYFNIDRFVPYYYKQRDYASLVIDEDFFPEQNYLDISSWNTIWGYISFIYDIIRCTLEQVKWNNVYFYVFEIDSVLNWSKRRSPDAARISGACHGDELGYLFKMYTTPEIIEGSFEDVSIDRMVTMWTNFAIYGMPIIQNESLLDHQQWLPVRGKDAFHSMRIGRNLTHEFYDMTNVSYWARLHDAFTSGIL